MSLIANYLASFRFARSGYYIARFYFKDLRSTKVKSRPTDQVLQGFFHFQCSLDVKTRKAYLLASLLESMSRLIKNCIDGFVFD